MKKICPLCNGSGQLSSFKGVSRFLLSWEECPECGGLGYLLPRDADRGTRAGNQDRDDKEKAGKTKSTRRRDRN